MDESLVSFDQEDARATRGVQDGDFPLGLVPGQHPVEDEINQVARRVDDAGRGVGVAATDKLLVDAANELQGNHVEGVMLPEEALPLPERDVSFDKAGEEPEVAGVNAPLFGPALGLVGEQVAIEFVVQPPE